MNNSSIQKTKNTFQDGLVMDFSPDNTSASTLTAALNATFITNNGNDMSLQNDMGNAMVETAYLPEGYIPVGTCEFGDIIYIVSYNPLTNRSLIGCFPSPERNISSEELHNPNLFISVLDFLETDNGKSTGNPTGKLRTTSVKKVLIDKKKLNPGDKYIIYTDNKNYLTGNAKVLSNWNQSLKHKYIKLSIVSIEDGGKITYLDSTTKWYDIEDDGKKYKYIINYSLDNEGGKPDIDSYRDMLNSGWSIFSSKVSGKLAILAELETIDTFSCYYIIKDIQDGGVINNIKYKTYSVQLAYDYQSENGLPPSYLCLTKSNFLENAIMQPTTEGIYLYSAKFSYSGGSKEILLKYPEPNANSGFKCTNEKDEVIKTFDFFDITIPYSEIINGEEYRITSSDFIYPFQITPAMDFGRLDHLAVDMTIDFNKIGTGEIDVTKWKYHNSGNTSILQYGLEVYTKPGWKVDDVTIEFYDNLSTPAGVYYVNNKESYTGTFTEYLGLNGESINSKFSKYYSNGNVIRHKGLELSEKPEGLNEPTKDNPLVLNESYIGEYSEDNIKWYQNDAGTLYSNILYLAKISIKQSKGLDTKSKEDDETSTDVFYRWFWTNNMYNQYFYSVDDFKNLKFELNLDVQAIFESKSNFEWKLNTIDKLMLGTDLSTTASSNIQYIGQDGVPNINMYTVAGLQDDYGCFTLYAGDKLENLKNFDLEIYLGNSTITYDTSELKYEFSQEERSLTQEGAKYLSLINQEDTKNEKSGIITNIDTSDFNPLVNNERHPDVFGVTHNIKNNDQNISIEIPDPEIDGNKYKKLETDLSQCYYISENENEKHPIELTLSAALFNNAYTEGEVNTKITAPVYVPIINSYLDLKKLGIEVIVSEDGIVKFMFSSGIVLNMYGDNYSSGTKLSSNDDFKFINAEIDDSQRTFETNKENTNTYSDDNFINNVWNEINDDEFPLFFLVYFGGIPNAYRYGVFTGDNVRNYANITNWRTKRTNKDIYDAFKEPDSTDELSKWQGYLIPDSAFDITKDAKFKNIKPGNVVAFLGMKYKNGFTLFNQAYYENIDENKQEISQQELLNISKLTSNDPYPNFAYILYLLLSRMYYKDCLKDVGKLISIKNHVKLAPYKTTLIKDVITKLEVRKQEKNEEDSNYNEILKSLILMSGIDYKGYIDSIFYSHILLINESEILHTSLDELKKSTTPIFTDVAKNNQLTLTINSSSLDFPELENKGYIEYNNLHFLCDLLENNQIYIFNVEDTFPTEGSKLSLVEFNNNSINIRQFDVSNNLKHILKDKDGDEEKNLPQNLSLYNSNTERFIKYEHNIKEDEEDNVRIIVNSWKDYLNLEISDFENINTLYELLNYFLEKYFFDPTLTLDLDLYKNSIINLILGNIDNTWMPTYSEDIYNKIGDKDIEEYNIELTNIFNKIKNEYSLSKMILDNGKGYITSDNYESKYKPEIINEIILLFSEKDDTLKIEYRQKSETELLGDGEDETSIIRLRLYDNFSLVNFLYETTKKSSCELYTIKNPNLKFIYDSKLKLDEKYSYSIFGVSDDLGKYTYGYTGFLRDIVFDNRYKIVP